MPTTNISGFVKKRTASQRYKRSPRQLTRDITVALEMRDIAMLSHLRIRTEDGAVFEGTELTPDQIKSLRDEGQNPMWFLRTSWLEETFGRRGAGESLPDESDPENDTVPELQERKTDAGSDPLTEMMKETIRELKVDKVHLVEQIKIKDDQIKQTTERWKESNVLTKDLHTLIQKMEQGMLGSPQDNNANDPTRTSTKADTDNAVIVIEETDAENQQSEKASEGSKDAEPKSNEKKKPAKTKSNAATKKSKPRVKAKTTKKHSKPKVAATNNDKQKAKAATIKPASFGERLARFFR